MIADCSLWSLIVQSKGLCFVFTHNHTDYLGDCCFYNRRKCSGSVKFFWKLHETELIDKKSKLQWMYNKADICTPKLTITLENKENENLCYDTSPKYICKKPLPTPFLVNQQGKKCSFETEEGDNNNDKEFDASLTVVDGFLKTFDESIITQMISDISEKEIEKTVENEIKLLLDHIIDRDIKKTKEKTQTKENEEFSVIEISEPPIKNDWSHYKAESAKSVQDFLWSEGDEIESSKKMTTHMTHTPTKDIKEVENIKNTKQEKRNELFYVSKQTDCHFQCQKN
ncbi:6108_t:CDS:2 [Diversispora eburnea]|uniref:6108_t:CDS:1 n=1 Tax=Diversispora eburnea TaxID=1213867 RepID=A0A9N8YMA5_9GLOM|nr:6108_t:CDS:2 [Diversispora eburnea]